jgi:hypothetical protein
MIARVNGTNAFREYAEDNVTDQENHQANNSINIEIGINHGRSLSELFLKRFKTK